MKLTALIFALSGTLVLQAQTGTTNSVPAPAVTNAAATPAAPSDADPDAAPREGFPANRYQALWTKSPFAVETPEAGEESPDYSLVGVAQFDGVFYASLVQKQNSEHFLVSSDKPYKGLTLTAITRGRDVADTTASLIKDGQPITLKLESGPVVPPAPIPGMPSTYMPNIAMPGIVPQNIPMPGSPQSQGMMPVRPLVRIHRPAIHLPPRAMEPGQATPAPGLNNPPPNAPPQ